MKLAAASIALLALVAESGATRPGGAPRAPLEVTEWTVPWPDSRPRDPSVDAQGRVWFVGQVGNYLAHLDPKTGRFERFELPAKALPHNLVVDAGGDVWYAGNGDAHIGRFDPRTGKVRRYPMPDSAARDPHTLVLAANGDLWFTVQGGNFVGHLARESGQVRLVRVPTARARPYGIVLDAKGRPWVNEFGTNKIATIDPATYRLREYELPAEGARGRRIGITRDGMVWFVDYARGFLGRLDPASGVVKEWAAPSADRSRPYAMAVDDRDRLWFVETGVQPNQLVGFDPKSGEFFSVTPIQPSGARTVRHMVFHQPTRTLWFGTDANTIARARLP